MIVLIPMSGLGSRFKEKGYKLPKPLIDVNGKPMIKRVVDNLEFKAKYIFLALKEHCDQFNLLELLPSFCETSCEVVVVDKLTEGAACTALLAKHLIDNDEELIIANSDQLVDFDKDKFLEEMKNKNADGGILTFKATDSKWSFAKLKENSEEVELVAEKNPISDLATCGVYYYKSGKDFVKYAEQMIEKNIRTKCEFYICPIYNEFISDNKKIYTYNVDKMHPIGTPEDLSSYLNSNDIIL